MARYPSSGVSYSFGPGGITPAVKILIITNVIAFVLNLIVDVMTIRLGLWPKAVFEDLALWQPFTYMFLHSIAGVGHVLINMLSLWMFGTELERTWGTRFFTKYYFVTGVGAAATSLLLSLFVDGIYYSVTVGASGAIYGLLLAYALYFPDRPIYMYMVFPIPAKYFVMIMGALAFFSSIGERSGVANATHLGGLIVAYLFLKSGRLHPIAEVKYRYLKWKINRTRAKFDVYTGGRANDWDRRVH